MIDDAEVRAALELAVPPTDCFEEWSALVARAATSPRSRRAISVRPAVAKIRSRMVVAAAAIAAATLVASPAFGLDRYLRALADRIDIQFAGAPHASAKTQKAISQEVPASGALGSKARYVGTLRLGASRRRLWVAPTRRGGYCYLLERAITSCADEVRYRWIPQLTVNAGGGSSKYGEYWSATIHRPDGPSWGGGMYANAIPGGQDLHAATRLVGDTTAIGAEHAVVHFADGRTMSLELLWVSAPISAGFFAYDVPRFDQRRATRVVAVTVTNARHRQLAKVKVPWGVFGGPVPPNWPRGKPWPPP